jgi:putative PIN family toxin of toxin-antitoxin system
MRVVLDTNVLISATLIRDGNEDRILRAWLRGAFEVVASPQMLQELGRALFYEKLRRLRWMSEPEVVSLLRLFAQEAVMVAGEISASACRDPDDNKFLAAAAEGGAQYVVSGDKALLEVKRYRGAQIVTPAAFLRILRDAEKAK